MVATGFKAIIIILDIYYIHIELEFLMGNGGYGNSYSYSITLKMYSPI